MTEADLTLDLQFGLGLSSYGEGGEQPPASRAIVGQPLIVTFSALDRSALAPIQWMPPHHAQVIKSDYELEMMFEHAGTAFVEATALESDKPTNQSPARQSRAEVHLSSAFIVSAAPVQTVRGNLGVTLHRGASEPTLDEALFYLVRNRTHAISFDRYRRFMNRILLWEENQRLPEPLERRLRDLGAHLYGTGPYQVLKLATEIFLLMECGVPLGRHHRHHQHHEFGTSAEDALTISGASDSHELAERLSQYLIGRHRRWNQ